MLKCQQQWDMSQLQLSAEKTDMKRQVERLGSENDEIRRALQKLLELVECWGVVECWGESAKVLCVPL